MNKINISNVDLVLSNPVEKIADWIGQKDILEQLMACWLTVSDKDLALTPRIIGVPGIGKTTLGMAAAKMYDSELYIFQCTADTRPEDLIVTPVLDSDSKISYHASPLVTAIIRGGICILDEGNRMNEKSWASIASLLDYRRRVDSIAAGITIEADKNFRCCVTMNDDESTYELPDYILSRLSPGLELAFPDKEDEIKILKYHLPFSDETLISLTVDFLQEAHNLNLDYSTRDGLNLIRYILKRQLQNKDNPINENELWQEALVKVLGEESLDLEKLSHQKKMEKGNFYTGIGLDDIFFNEE